MAIACSMRTLKCRSVHLHILSHRENLHCVGLWLIDKSQHLFLGPWTPTFGKIETPCSSEVLVEVPQYVNPNTIEL